VRKIFDKLEEVVSVISLLIITTITFINVIMRQFAGLSLSFTEEISVNMFILVTLMGASIAAKRNEHLGVTIIFDRFGWKLRKAIRIFTLLLTIVYLAVISGYGFLMVKGEYVLGMKTATMQWPEWMFGSFVFIGSLFVLVRHILRVIDVVKAKEGEVL